MWWVIGPIVVLTLGLSLVMLLLAPPFFGYLVPFTLVKDAGATFVFSVGAGLAGGGIAAFIEFLIIRSWLKRRREREQHESDLWEERREEYHRKRLEEGYQWFQRIEDE